MSSASATRIETRLDRERLAVGAVADDRLEHLRDDDRALGLVVDPVEELLQLRRSEEEREVLVPVTVDRHADAVGERRERDDHFGVVVGHAVVGDDGRLDVVLRQLAEELQRDVGDDLDVNPGVVVDLHPATAFTFETCHHALSCLSSFTRSITVRSLRLPRTGTLIFIRSIGFGGRQRRFVLGLRGDGLVDPLSRFLVDRHVRAVYVHLRP